MAKGMLLAAGLVVLGLAPALAEGRPDTRALDCRTVQRLVDREGAIVLTTGDHTYDRYVAARSFCPVPYEPVPASVPTADTNDCVVYRCDEPLFRDDF